MSDLDESRDWLLAPDDANAPVLAHRKAILAMTPNGDVVYTPGIFGDVMLSHDNRDSARAGVAPHLDTVRVSAYTAPTRWCAMHYPPRRSCAMSTQGTLKVFVGEVDVPLELAAALIRKHLLRSLRLAVNGHAPSPQAPPPAPDPIPAPLEDAAPAPASRAGVP